MVYEPSFDAFTPDRLNLDSEIRGVADRDELRLYFQPYVHLETGALVGLEALVRWEHPRLGLLSPAEFIPLAEENGEIVKIDRWVLRAACAQTRRWRSEHPEHHGLMVNVNLSPQEFLQADLVFQVARALRESELSASGLQIETTEGSLMTGTITIETLEELRRIGVRLAIDDFGTGYSSLSYVSRLPIDALKIDRAFVEDLCNSEKARAVCRGVITLANSLTIDVIAEGIETPEQLDALLDLGCYKGQGYFFAKPGDLLTTAAVLSKGTHPFMQGITGMRDSSAG